MQALSDIVSQYPRPPMNGAASYPPAQVSSADIRKMPRVRLADIDSSHPRVAAAVEAARTWVKRYNAFSAESDCAPWLILSGPNGTGKTLLARVIFGAFRYTSNVYEGYDYGGGPAPDIRIDRPIGRFWPAYELMELLAPARDDAGAVGIGTTIGSAPIVVIDDVGAEGVLQYVGKEHQEYERQTRYFRFLDFCYVRGNSIPGVMTTNLSLEQLAEHVGPRAWDRLMQMAPAGQMVDMSGVPSWRVKAGGR